MMRTVWTCCSRVLQADHQDYSWYAADRAAKVAALIPGRGVPKPPPEEFLWGWTMRQVEKWEEKHPALDPEEAYQTYAGAEPTDQYLTEFIPDHISPFARVVAGNPDPLKAHSRRRCLGNQRQRW